jgi:hypothetical protein
MDWALARDRDAWSRTRAAVAASGGSYRLEDLEAARDRLTAEIEAKLPAWLEAMLKEAGRPARVGELDQPAEQVWRTMLCLNSGIFATQAAREPFHAFMITIPSAVPEGGPLYMSPNLDGWGIEPAPG